MGKSPADPAPDAFLPEGKPEGPDLIDWDFWVRELHQRAVLRRLLLRLVYGAGPRPRRQGCWRVSAARANPPRNFLADAGSSHMDCRRARGTRRMRVPRAA